MGSISGSPRRARDVVGEVLRFLTVGGLATAVSFVGFNALAHGFLLGAAPLHDEPVLAFVVANVVAGLLAYVGMSVWAFRDRTAGTTTTGVVRFFLLGALTMLVPVLCLWVSRYVLGLSGPVADNLAANVVGLGLGAATRYWVFRRYVFDEVEPVEARATAA